MSVNIHHSLDACAHKGRPCGEDRKVRAGAGLVPARTNAGLVPALAIAVIICLASRGNAQSPISHSSANFVMYDGAAAGSDNYLSFAVSSALNANYQLLIPNTVPSVGQALNVSSVSGTDATMGWATISSGSGTPNQIAYWTSSTALGGSDSLWWNNTTTRMGVHNNSPSQLLDVGGTLFIDDASAGVAGQLQMMNPAGTFATTFAAGAQTKALNYTWPVSQGAANSLLTLAGTGHLSWLQPGEGTYWVLLGNAGTTSPSPNFIGTTDAQAFVIKTGTGPTERMRLLSTGNVGINTTTPGATLAAVTSDAGTSAIVVSEILGQNSSGTPATGFGSSLSFYSADATVSSREQGNIGVRWTTATDASRSSAMTFSTVSSGTTTQRMIIDNNGYVGINNNAPNVSLDFSGTHATRRASLSLTSASSNDNVAIGNSSFLDITGPTANFQITGLANGVDGKMVRLFNNTGYKMTIKDQVTSTAANQIVTGASGDLTIVGASQTVDFIYDANSSRWRMGTIMGTAIGALGSLEYVIKGADQSVTNTVTLQTDNTLAFGIPANQTWEIHGELDMLNDQGASDSDIQFNFGGVSGTTIRLYYEAVSASTSGGSSIQGCDLISVLDQDYSVNIAQNVSSLVRIRGIFSTGSTAGTLTLKWRIDKKNSSPTLTMKKTSYLSRTRVQ